MQPDDWFTTTLAERVEALEAARAAHRHPPPAPPRTCRRRSIAGPSITRRTRAAT